MFSGNLMREWERAVGDGSPEVVDAVFMSSCPPSQTWMRGFVGGGRDQSFLPTRR